MVHRREARPNALEHLCPRRDLVAPQAEGDRGKLVGAPAVEALREGVDERERKRLRGLHVHPCSLGGVEDVGEVDGL